MPIEELLKIFEYDEKVFKGIKFKYIYLPFIPIDENEKDLMNYPKYTKNFEEILNLLNTTNKYNSVSSLMNFIDSFNEAINGNGMFDNQTILKDIEIDFNGVYNKYENKLKISLIEKMPNLAKFVKLDETFEDFIKKINLTFVFKINDEDLTFYGSSSTYDDYYEKLKKNKTFRIDPEDIFLDLYTAGILRLKCQNKKNQQEIYNKYINKKSDIDNYFSLLKFYQDIEYMDLKLKIDNNNDQIEYKLERENDLKNYFVKKTEEKKEEWENQIERAKWKTPVQAYGEMKCENGHDLGDIVHCHDCHEPLYWVDSDERYSICKGCNEVRKISGNLICSGCGARSLSKVKWIKGYKP